jgi:Ser/Thr protein kinase RdoA (MazF antagonist)
MAIPRPKPQPNLWVPRNESARTRKLAAVARQALAAYDLPIATLSPLSIAQNWIYRLVTTDGRRFIVRVNRPGFRTPLDVASEMAWLAALRRDTDLIVPEPVADRAGGFVQVLDGPGPDAAPDTVVPHSVAVFGWIDGPTVGDTVGVPTARAMGVAVGRLQDHADGFVPPIPFSTARLDRAYTFGRRPAALADGAPPDPLFPPERRALIDRAADRAQDVIDALHADPAALRFLHIDLHTGNVKRLKGGGIALLDFDDSRWAHPVQDFAIPLFYFWVRARGQALWDAYAAGYASVRGNVPADDATLRALVAGRQVDLVSFVLESKLLADEVIPAWLERVEGRLRRLEAGA